MKNTPVIAEAKVMVAEMSPGPFGSKKMYQALPSTPVSSSMKNKVVLSTWPWPTGVGLLYSANETPGVAMTAVGSAACTAVARQSAANAAARRVFMSSNPLLFVFGRPVDAPRGVILGSLVVRRNTADRGSSPRWRSDPLDD